MGESELSEAGDPATDPARLTELAASPDEYVRRGVAWNRSAPVDVLTLLADDSDDLVRQGVAGNPSTPTSLITRLADDPDKSVRSGVAVNPSAPVDLLTLLADNQNWTIRNDLARNPSTPVGVLKRLAEDSDWSVRASVAGNSSAPAELIWRLSEDPEPLVRASLAREASAPVELIVLLSGDSDERVRNNVAGNVATPAQVLTRWANSNDSGMRRGVAWNRSAPVDLLTLLADDSDDLVRQGVAGNPSSPVELLTRLADDPEAYVRSGVAGNPSSPVELLTRLADDSEAYVRSGVARNLGAPVDLLMHLANDSDESVRGDVARNRSAPVDVLTLLADDSDDLVRQGVAGNPSAPVEVRARARLIPEVPERPALSSEMLEKIEGQQRRDLQSLLPGLGAWVFYRHVEEYEHDYGGFTAEVTSPVAWDTRDWWLFDLRRAERITGESASHDAHFNSYPENIGALLPASDGPPDWFQPGVLAGGDEPAGDALLELDWRRLVSEEATAEDLAALVEESESAFPGSDLVSAVVARHPSSPDELLSRLVAGDDDEIRWLLTRNPGASDTVKSAAVLAGVKEPFSILHEGEDDDEDDEDQDGEVADDSASFSRKIEMGLMGGIGIDIDLTHVTRRWAARTLTRMDVIDFLSDNVLDVTDFLDWAGDHCDSDGQISTADFTEWLKEECADLSAWSEWLEWLDERCNVGLDARNDDAWDEVTREQIT